MAGIRLRHKLTRLVIVVEKVEADYGVLIKNQRAFQQLADSRGLVIDVRPINKDSVPHLLRGALYKPVDIKAKTINSADVFLGIQPEKKGLVGKLSKREYRQLIQDMIEGEFGVMHGAVVYWKPKGKSERKMKKKLVAQHLRGGSEGLVRFAPNQPMRFVFGDTPVGR